MKQIPNIFTLANLFCGALAIIFILQSPSYISNYNGQDYVVTAPAPIYWSSVLIAIAAIIDFFDGMLARLMKAESAIGKELDSLADIVTFGVAPAMIMYELLRNAYMELPDAINVSVVNLSFALLIPCFGAYRLARFNTEKKSADYFKGLPIPVTGLLVASFPMIILFQPFHLDNYLQNIWILYGIIFLLCYLMVSGIKMINLKFRNFGWKDNWSRYLLIIIIIVSVPLLHFAAAPVDFVVYILLSLLSKKTTA
jgi:CDP-diacylglycerol---serine O-phosphatidyltransferase